VKFELGFKPQAGEFTARAEFERLMPQLPSTNSIVDDDTKSPRHRGQREGAQFVPHHDIPSPASLHQSEVGIEREAATLFERARSLVLESLRILREDNGETLKTDNNFPQKIEAPLLISQIDAFFERELGKFDSLRKNLRIDLGGARTEFTTADKEFGVFRKRVFGEHDGAPRDPKKMDRRRMWTILGLCLLVEVGFNGSVFSRAVEGGALEGVIIAFGLSLFNVLSGFYLGYLGWRYTFFENRWRPLATTFSVALFLGLFVLNLLFAHERDAMIAAIEGGQARTIADAFISVMSNPLNIQDIVGLLLFIAGICSILVSAWEGYQGFEDPIPEYGDRHSKCAAAKKRLETLEARARDIRKQQFYDPLCADLEAIRLAVNTIYNLERGKADMIREVGMRVRGYFGSCRAGLVSLSNQLAQMILEYRAENRKARRAKLRQRRSFWRWLVDLFRPLADKTHERQQVEIDAKVPAYFDLPMDQEREFQQPDDSHFAIPKWPDDLVREAHAAVEANEIERSAVLKKIDDLIRRVQTTLAEGQDQPSPEAA
jgi:hypothetical protein